MISHSQKDVHKALSIFIWEFKVADNIEYNLRILFELYSAEKKSQNTTLYTKPYIVILVSMIEAIMYDFVSRLDGSTRHFPAVLDEKKKQEVIDQIEKSKTYRTVTVTGKSHKVKTLKNYGLSELIKIFHKHHLLGTDDDIYTKLETVMYLRNRVHIINYFQNLEVDEDHAFTFSRLSDCEQLFDYLLDYMKNNYKRPW